MIGIDGHLKLCDLGLSKVVSDAPRRKSATSSLQSEGMSLMKKLFPSKLSNHKKLNATSSSRLHKQPDIKLTIDTSSSASKESAKELSPKSKSVAATPDDSDNDYVTNAAASFETTDLFQHSQVGTPGFMAPETIKKQTYNKAIDWWAFGVTVYECICREKLFAGDTKDEIFKGITDKHLDLGKLKSHSEELYDFVKKLLERESKLRLGSDDVNSIKIHPYFSGINWSTISSDECGYHPPQHNFKADGPRDVSRHRYQFYGDEDPEAKARPLKMKSYNSSRRRGNRDKKWNLSRSLSKTTINEMPDEDNNDDSVESNASNVKKVDENDTLIVKSP